MPSRTLRSLLGLSLAVAVLPSSLPALAGQVYQWKDSSGVTHFSDSPPPDQQHYQNRQLKEGPPPTAQAAATPSEDPNCVTARKNLAQLQGSTPVGLDADGDGKPDKIMTAEERSQQVQLAEQTIKTYCNKPAGG